MTDQELGLFKQALQRGAGGLAPAVAVKIWRTIDVSTPAAAVSFLNLAPAQGAGEAFVGPGPNGTVQLYYFM